MDSKVKSIKERYEHLGDKIIGELDKCSSKEQVKDTRDYLDKVVKADSEKFMEEIQVDAKDMKDDFKVSSLSKESIDIEHKKVDEHVESTVMLEGKRVSELLNKLDEEYKETKDFYDMVNDSENSDDEGSKNNIGSKSGNKSQNNIKDKQSPIDFVVEKQPGEKPDIPNSDGGE